MLSLYEILKASKTGNAPDMWTALAGMNWGGVGSGAEVKELTGIPPLSIRSNGTMLLDYLISGNMSQSGTPTPQNPIQPQETGERTGNLADTLMGGVSTTDGSDTVYTSNQSQVRSQYILCTPNTQYTVSANKYPVQNFIAFYNENKEYVSRTSGIPITQERIFEVPDNAVYMRVTFTHATAEQLYPYIDEVKIMLNLGSTALPYEPYGYKILISSASTTTPVYLGEVETTRRIKKLVLTGEESTAFYTKNTTSADNSLYFIRFEKLQSVPPNRSPLYCTHLQNLNYTPSAVAGINVASTYNVIYLNLGLDVMNTQPSGNTVVGLREYFAAQYAAGTPVTVWYILAEPEIGIVNEPIRKIGDYADTLSMEQAGVNIPTNNGSTTIDVETTLKPSEVYIKWKGV